jgi:predicted nucleotide-binding protein (sugar kinase/HSP70/actin superfamily)
VGEPFVSSYKEVKESKIKMFSNSEDMIDLIFQNLSVLNQLEASKKNLEEQLNEAHQNFNQASYDMRAMFEKLLVSLPDLEGSLVPTGTV